MKKNKMKIVMCSDDPDTILSYGILSNLLIEEWYRHYELHYVSLQRPMGIAFKRDKKYTKYPAHNQGERNPTFLPEVLNKVRPQLLWTNFDVQHYQNIDKFVPPQQMWVGWIPWDNHDPGQIPRAQNSFKKVDIRVAISKFGYEFLTKHGVQMDDYVYNIVDTNYFKPVRDNEPRMVDFKRKNPWFKEDMKVLLFVGRPNWRKRMIHLLRVVHELKRRGNKNFVLFMHSNPNDPARTVDIDELVNALGIEDCVIRSRFDWDTGIPKEELNIIYNVADLYLAPHGGEGFGMPIAEAMATGTPFIASDYCTTREFAGANNERGIPSPIAFPMNANGTPKLDKGVMRPYPIVKDFADRIEQLWEDEKRMKIMGKNGIKWVNENCTPKLVADKWMKIMDTFDINIGGVTGYNE